MTGGNLERNAPGRPFPHPPATEVAPGGRATPVRAVTLLRGGAWSVAAGRVALGVAALALPSLPARPWVGLGSGDVAVRVFGRALGARDLALGVGALAALRGAATQPVTARTWVAAGAAADALDLAATLAAWPDLPRWGRWLVAAAAGGAAVTGAAGALSLRADPAPPPARSDIGRRS